MLIFKKMTVVSLFLLAVIFLLPKLALAQDNFGINDLNNISVYSTRNIFETIAGIVNIVLGFLGAITVLLFLYAGFLWMTSRGARDRIDQAKKIITSATIGLGIIFVSYALVNFIFRSAYQGLFGGNNLPGGGNPGGSYYGGGALLGGVLESHFPVSNAINIPRNTNIIVTFREPIELDDVLYDDNCDPVNNDCAVDRENIMIFVAGNENSNLAQGDLFFRVDSVHKNFTFNPVNLLGDSGEPVIYTVRLNNLRTGNGLPAFPGGYYNWNFAVGTWVDEVRPTVTSVIPVASSVVPRNTIVQVNFSESMNPLDMPAVAQTGANITVTGPAGLVNGVFQLSNQYRTVEFVSSNQCGQNDCGDTVFCLPTGDISGFLSNNLTDMAGNRLNGNQASGDYTWQFETNNQVDLAGPVMTYRDISNQWNIYAPMRVGFDSTLSAASVNHSSVNLNWNINYWLGLASYDGILNNSIMIYHDPMLSNTQYEISCLSGIKDIRQNCYYPCSCPGGPGCGLNPPPGVPCAPGACVEQ